MGFDIQTLWPDIQKVIQRELTDISFNTWIAPLKPIIEDKDAITIEAPTEFHMGILMSRYDLILKNAIRSVTSRNYNLSYTSAPRKDLYTQQQYNQSFAKAIDKSLLNAKFTFGNFIVGNSNRFAYTSAVQAAKGLPDLYNPLFIYGDAGMGKTHLLHAIGHKIIDIRPEAKVLFTSIDHFINDMINFIRNDQWNEMVLKYEQADVWLIDNIQFLDNKEMSQQEFFKVYNALLHKGKQIIMTCSTSPRDLNILKNRFSTAFDLGLVAYIEPFDVETKIAVMKKYCLDNEFDIPLSVIKFIADTTASNYREIRTAINSVWMYAMMFEERELNIELAKEALKSCF